MSKVVHLRPPSLESEEIEHVPVQLKLFREESWTNGVIGYLDVAAIGQTDLQGFIAEHSIRQVLDIRRSAAFPKPKFKHKELFDYFSAFGIHYVDCYSCARAIYESSPSIFAQRRKLDENAFSTCSLSSAPSIVIFNSEDGAEYLQGFMSLFPASVISSKLFKLNIFQP